jgi:hypothetical protein
MPNVCWKTRPPNLANILSIKNSSMLKISVSENFLDLSHWAWNKGYHRYSEGRLRTKLYNKRDDFNFPIVNFPFICSNIPAASVYGGYIVNLVTNPVISREWRKNREVFKTSGTYLWSFVTQIFHSGQPSHGGDRKVFEVMTSTLPKGTLGSVASLYMEDISLRWYDIPKLVVPIRISLIEGCC